MSSIVEFFYQLLQYFHGLWRNDVELDARILGILWTYKHDPKEEPVNRVQAPKVIRSSQGMQTSSFIMLRMVEEITLENR